METDADKSLNGLNDFIQKVQTGLKEEVVPGDETDKGTDGGSLFAGPLLQGLYNMHPPSASPRQMTFMEIFFQQAEIADRRN